MATIQIRDEELTGQSLDSFSLEVLTDRMTVRELIRSRVYQQVRDRKLQQARVFRGLLPEQQSQATQKGTTAKSEPEADWKLYYEKAIEAFEANRILVLVGERQTESLDDEFDVDTQTSVTFMRLVPLVGG